MCSNLNGTNAPFCSPLPDSNFTVGQTISVTWDPSYLTNLTLSSSQIQLQTTFTPITSPGIFLSSTHGFATPINTTTSSYTFTAQPSFLGNQTHATADFALALLSESPGTDVQTTISGPRVLLLPARMGFCGHAKVIVGTAAGVGVLVLGLVACWVYLRRRKGADGASWWRTEGRPGHGRRISKSQVQLVQGDVKIGAFDGEGMGMGVYPGQGGWVMQMGPGGEGGGRRGEGRI